MARGFLYLVAIMDWYSRYVLSWRLSNTLDADFCVAALEEELSRGMPEIFNTGPGSQFTSEAFTGTLGQQGVRISMDGKGRYLDNLFIERLWRTVKYDEVYLKAYESVRQARKGIEDYLRFYNTQRLHQGLGYRAPIRLFDPNIEDAVSSSWDERSDPQQRAVVIPGKVGSALTSAGSLS